MSEFSAAWLDLRQPADHRARSLALTLEMAGHLATRFGAGTQRDPLQVIDLATGTGSNPRYLAPHLSAHQEWTLLDADRHLLAALPTRMAAWATHHGWACTHSPDGVAITSPTADVRLHPKVGDISHFPLAGIVERPALVTAAALLDLVSEDWVGELVAWCRSIGASVLFALTYDGRTSLVPEAEDDDLILRLVNMHQTQDKGFGRALGPRAAGESAAAFERAGFVVRREKSDWIIEGAEARLQDELIVGWTAAAREVAPADRRRIDQWEQVRRQAAGNGELVITVGHEDLAAWPPSGRE